jgi:methylenetetrahydrofolate dehydrogenase (NADP+)/methenyltetrahydrofolate cyclohydrolase
MDGKKIADTILDEVRSEIAELTVQNRVPKLGVLLIGNDPASVIFVKETKRRVAEGLHIPFAVWEFSGNVDFATLQSEARKIQQDPLLGGIIVQLPLPTHLPKQEVLDLIEPIFDIEGLTTINQGKFFAGTLPFVPPTPGAVLEILRHHRIEIPGKVVVIVGAGTLVGKPLGLLFMQEKATVIILNSSTKNLGAFTTQADILISATGQAGLIRREMVKEGAVVIDAGTAEASGKITGDVAIDEVIERASFLAPVPGGVGPVTVAMLFKNLLIARRQRGA